jgi:hypothetical protein
MPMRDVMALNHAHKPAPRLVRAMDFRHIHEQVLQATVECYAQGGEFNTILHDPSRDALDEEIRELCHDEA